MPSATNEHERWMRLALRLAARGIGRTTPNPAVGAVLVRRGVLIGQGWHHRAGAPHAEIEAIRDATARGHTVRGSTLYVTLEPCSTYGRTPPCTKAIVEHGVRKVFAAANDPNPSHRGAGLSILRKAGVETSQGMLESESCRLNEAFNHWIVHRTPWVVVKAAMTIDGKIATREGRSKWITSDRARRDAMRLRLASDAVLVGVETVLQDDPELTVRGAGMPRAGEKPWRRIVLDTRARIPLTSRLVRDDPHRQTLVVVGASAPPRKIAALERHVKILKVREDRGRIDLRALLRSLGGEGVTQLLAEGGGEVQSSFVLAGLAHRVVFYYAPLVLGGTQSRRAVAGDGARSRDEAVALKAVEWRRLGPDLRMTGLTVSIGSRGRWPRDSGED